MPMTNSHPISRRLLLGGAAGITAAGLAGVGTRTAHALPEIGTTIHPRGQQFPLGWYDIGADRPADQVQEPMDPLVAMQSEKRFGWNMVHRYADDKPRHDEIMAETLRLAEIARMGALLQLPYTGKINDPGGRVGVPEAEFAAYVQRFAASPALAWWDIPEEMRYWYRNEMDIVRNYSAWARQYDPLQRPVMMYTPNHYSASALANYIPYIDIAPISSYTTYAGQPHVWVRWRMEQMLQAIELAGAEVGSDYLAGQKTPIAALELYHASTAEWMTPEGTYHDFWAALASGARGIFVYSFYRRNGGPVLLDSLDAYNKAASELTSGDRLDQVLLNGTDADDVTFEVLSGQPEVDPFTPYGVTEPITLPSVKVLAKRHDGVLHVIAVNSHTEPVSIRLSGSRRSGGMAQLPYEHDQVRITDGSLDLDFPGLGVHVLRIGED
ncbi:hypothetical protein [Microlunatus sp. Y2014]|uniref:hypothetical protein n=1 Tax=Microlunatus sp. Y2014 TaxID=3418488 RepID=UPI003DA711C0